MGIRNVKTLGTWALAACFPVAVLALFFFAHRPEGPSAQSAYFAEALSSTQERVHINGRWYTVELGDVRREEHGALSAPERLSALKLAYAVSLLRRNALLSLEGTDIERLEEALGELEAAQRDAAVEQTSEDASLRVSQHLFPLSFLRSLVALEKARRDTLERGTWDAYREYERILGLTLLHAERDLRGFESAYSAAVTSVYDTIATPIGLLTKDATLNALSDIRTRFYEVGARTRERKACMAGFTGTCEPLADRPMPHVQDFGHEETWMRHVVALYDEAEEARLEKRAIIGLAGSACVESENEVAFVDMKYFTHSKFPMYLYVGDLFISTFDGTKGPTLGWYASQGMKYMMYGPLVSYTCPRSADDIARARALVELANDMGARPADETIYESDVLGSVLKRKNEHSLAQGAERDIESDLRAYANGSAGFEDVVHGIASGLRSPLALQSRGAPVDMSEDFLFATRSGYYALFLAHNRTAGATSVNPYASDTERRFSSQFSLYSEKRGLIDTEQLAHDLRFFLSSHRALPPATLPMEDAAAELR